MGYLKEKSSMMIFKDHANLRYKIVMKELSAEKVIDTTEIFLDKNQRTIQIF